LTARHPRLAIEVDLDNRPVDLVAEGFDIGIRGGVIEDSSLVARRICSLPVVLVATPAYLQRHGVPRSVDELAQHRFVAVRHPGSSTVAWHFRRASGRRFEWVPPAAIQGQRPRGAGRPRARARRHRAGRAAPRAALPALGTAQARAARRARQRRARDRAALPHRQFLAPRVRVVVEALLAHFAQAADLHTTPAEAAAFASAISRRAGAGTPGDPAPTPRARTHSRRA
jgi:hypothetical protein